MGTYSKDRLILMHQGLSGGGKVWSYSDTGAVGGLVEVAGYVSDGHDMGVDTGDFVYLHTGKGATDALTTRGASFVSVTDTGNSATIGLSVLIGDTS